MIWQDQLAIAGFIITFIALILAILAIYISPPARWELPFRSKYHNLYGIYNIYNYSRERNDRIVVWDVHIRRRFLKIPEFSMGFKDQFGRYSITYTGDIVVEGSRMIARLSSRDRDDDYSDVCFLVFNTPTNLNIILQVGFMCGFRNPYVPYCGAHLLCRPSRIGRDEAAEILSKSHDLWHEDFDRRIDVMLERKGVTAQ